jgi:transporter family-2 protein
VGNWPVALLTLAAGLAGAVQVAVMGRFGGRVGVFEAFGFSALLTAAIALVALLAVRRSVGGFGDALSQPVWMLSGGIWGAVVVLTITLAAPRLGTFATIGVFLAAQLAMGVVIDRFGLFGLDRFPLHWPRVLGLVLLAAGAVLSLRR